MGVYQFFKGKSYFVKRLVLLNFSSSWVFHDIKKKYGPSNFAQRVFLVSKLRQHNIYHHRILFLEPKRKKFKANLNIWIFTLLCSWHNYDCNYALQLDWWNSYQDPFFWEGGCVSLMCHHVSKCVNSTLWQCHAEWNIENGHQWI